MEQFCYYRKSQSLQYANVYSESVFQSFFFFLISQTYLSKDPLLLFKHFQESGFVEDSLGKGEGFLLTRAISLFPSFHELNPHCGQSITPSTLLGQQLSFIFSFFLPSEVIKSSQKFPQCFAILDFTSFFGSMVQSCIPNCISCPFFPL